eukprot:scaffold256114_cov15-Tisochrysis_lutea.AAC.1
MPDQGMSTFLSLFLHSCTGRVQTMTAEVQRDLAMLRAGWLPAWIAWSEQVGGAGNWKQRQ